MNFHKSSHKCPPDGRYPGSDRHRGPEALTSQKLSDASTTLDPPSQRLLI
ncbi:Protein of unknown function [Pyronema omphalodes CBS 100304]|uniref:Uncharacterized protein n=1 Tax=Pyronema omphalodes (strain CBS 100304) TaxID=1076935 RepID=U4LNI6_PYROM|nr:Protein of unknown function [Pyronema omphalodes CBS 100304]